MIGQTRPNLAKVAIYLNSLEDKFMQRPKFQPFVEQTRQQQMNNAAATSAQPPQTGDTDPIKVVMDPYVTEIRTIHDNITKIQKDLLSQWERGEKPNAERVQELERTLVGLEESVREQELKLVQARGEVVGSALGGKKSPADLIRAFEGVFVKDKKGLKQALLDTRNPDSQSRAIDTGLFATGGAMPPEAADAFIDFVIQQQIALSRVVVRRMMAPTGYTDLIGITNRRLRRATEATAPGLSNSITTKRRTLTSREVIWAEDITRTLLEDNIERAGLELTIANLLSLQFGNDLNDLAWNGDEASVNPFISVDNGWLKLWSTDTDVNVVAAGALTSPSAVFQAMLQAVPFNFLARTDHLIWTTVRLAQKYADEFSKRETPAGDAVFLNGFPALRYFGIPVIPEPHLYNISNAVLTPAANLYFGVQRNIEVDSEYIIRRRVTEYTITARIDYEYITGTAVVRADAVPGF